MLPYLDFLIVYPCLKVFKFFHERLYTGLGEPCRFISFIFYAYRFLYDFISKYESKVTFIKYMLICFLLPVPQYHRLGKLQRKEAYSVSCVWITRPTACVVVTSMLASDTQGKAGKGCAQLPACWSLFLFLLLLFTVLGAESRASAAFYH